MTHIDLDAIRSTDGAARTRAYFAALEITEQPVDWAYEVWDDLLTMLKHKDNHQRTIAAQLLSNLAMSDPEQRMLKDFNAVLSVTRDVRTVTARHSLQSIWKIGTVGEPQQQLVVDGLAQRFHECSTEKNCTLIRYDISKAMRKLYDAVQDQSIRATTLALIATETDTKYRIKYTSVWKGTAE